MTKIVDSARGLDIKNDDNDYCMDSKRVKSLAPLSIIAPEGLSAIGENEWEQFELAVDSGASETVVNET